MPIPTPGVKSVAIDLKTQKVTVDGLSPSDALAAAKKSGKAAELWS